MMLPFWEVAERLTHPCLSHVPASAAAAAAVVMAVLAAVEEAFPIMLLLLKEVLHTAELLVMEVSEQVVQAAALAVAVPVALPAVTASL
jgi:hypothetical protein